MGHIVGEDRYQSIMFPDRIDDYVDESNSVRVIDAFVNGLDLNLAGFIHAAPSPLGRNRYSARDLLKLYIYGYFNKIRSSRKLMDECRRNIEVMWLLCRLTPDFRTISDFRKENVKALKNVFKAFVAICLDLQLYEKELIAIDGSKFKASNSKGNNITRAKLEEKIKRIEKHFAEYLKDLEKQDESESSETQSVDIKQMLLALEQKKEEYNQLLKEMVEANETQKSFVDPDARLMRVHNGGYEMCYNVQTAVDSGSHLIVDFAATNNCSDMGLLAEYALLAKQELETDVLKVVVDTGYQKNEDIYNCLKNGIYPHVSVKHDQEAIELEIPYIETDVTEQMLQSTNPEDIESVLASGNIPDIYQDQKIEVSIIETTAFGDDRRCFVLSDDEETVICPEGKILRKVATLSKKNMTRYTMKSACSKCKNKCTTSKFKQLDLTIGQKKYILKGQQLRKSWVKITIRPNKLQLKKRKTIVEHPFGTIKRWCDGSYLLLRGLKKVNADLSLSFLAYNMKRVINMIGAKALIERLAV